LHAETQVRQALLQLILDTLPSSVYLVQGRDARLVLANRAAAQIWGASWPPGQPMCEFLAAETHMASLSVADRGIGIPVQQQARIFGRFERADNSRAYGIGGTGLGLYLSRALVEEHGGRIWVESVEGQGSTFFVLLPLSSESTPVHQ
jgi:signal transduction histidine kinase